jgi:hypothetical protein
MISVLFFENRVYSIKRYNPKNHSKNQITMSSLGTFDDFYNHLCDIEERETNWVDQDYAEEIAEKKWQRYLREKYIETMKAKANNNSRLKYREIDLRRKLLHRIGKYELEEGEIFE